MLCFEFPVSATKIDSCLWHVQILPTLLCMYLQWNWSLLGIKIDLDSDWIPSNLTVRVVSDSESLTRSFGFYLWCASWIIAHLYFLRSSLPLSPSLVFRCFMHMPFPFGSHLILPGVYILSPILVMTACYFWCQIYWNKFCCFAKSCACVCRETSKLFGSLPLWVYPTA